MGKTQFLGAVALAMLMTGVTGNTIYAIGEESMGVALENEVVEGMAVEVVEDDAADERQPAGQERTAAATAQMSTALATAITKAEAAQAYAAAHKSTVYPGIDKYIEKIIAAARAGKGSEAEAIEALNDASSLTYKLLGNNAQVNTTVSNAPSPVKAEPVKTETKAPEVAQVVYSQEAQGTVVVAETKPKEKNEENKENVEEGGAESQLETVNELPEAGASEKELGIGELTLAGVIVLLATAGIATVVIRSKRNA